MEMTTRDRIEQGLDRTGLIKRWDSLSNNTDYVRGLILEEAKTDCDNNSSMSQIEYFKGFKIDGVSITIGHVRKLILATTEQARLKKFVSSSIDNQSNSFKETEAKLSLPESKSTQMELRGDNAIQKARNYREIQEILGKEKPSAFEIRDHNKTLREAKEKSDREQQKKDDELSEYAESRKIPKKLPKPDPFTMDEEMDFETWCIEVHSFDVVAEKPKHTRAIYALKDEKVGTLFGRLDEWKSAFKIMAKLCHPETGGNTLAMSMLNDFNDLMKSLDGVKQVIEYEKKIEEFRVEYSAPKKIGA